MQVNKIMYMATISSRTDEHPECKGTTFLVDMPIKNRKCDPSDPQPRDIAAKINKK